MGFTLVWNYLYCNSELLEPGQSECASDHRRWAGRPLPRAASALQGRSTCGARARAQSSRRHVRLGGVFSDQTLGNLEAADAQTAREIEDAFNHWDDIDVHFRGRTIRSGGHGFCGIGRKRLLSILQRRARALDVELRFQEEVIDDEAAARDFDADIVVACDGINNRVRTKYAETYRPDIDLRRCRFVWLGTRQNPAFTFAFQKTTEHGWFQAHAYQYEGETSTFIVETPEDVWRAGGTGPDVAGGGHRVLRAVVRALPGWPSADEHAPASARVGDLDPIPARDLRGVDALERARRQAHAGRAVRRCGAHGASIGSGRSSRSRMRSRLPARWTAMRDLPAALEAYEAERSVEVLKLQNAARNSTEWFENVERYRARGRYSSPTAS